MSLAELLTSVEIGLIYGIISIGIYLTFRVIDFPDLSCDGSFVLGAATSSILIKLNYSPITALLSAMLAGSIAGSITGILHTRFKITDLLSGILVAFMLYSVNLRIMGGLPNIALLHVPTLFTHISPLIVLIIISLLIWLIISYLLITDFGLALRSVGQNKRLATYGGINVKNMIIVVLAISNSLIACGGALFSQHQSFTDIGSGIGTLIIGFVAVIVGEKILPFRSPWIMIAACFLGSIIYRIIISCALHSEVFGLETQDLNLITGLFVICIMILPRKRKC